MLSFQFLHGFGRACILQKKHIDIQFFECFSFCKINPGCLRLFFQRFELSGKLCQNICHTDQILTLIFQLLDRRIFSSLKLYDSCCLIKKLPAFFRLSAQDLVHLSLTNDRISFSSDTCIIEHLIDVL